MQDPRALRNSRTLSSWRAWQEEACRRSGFTVILAVVSPLLAAAFALFCTLTARGLGRFEFPVILTGGGLYLATILGLMTFAALRLHAWKRANPWTPPS